MPVTIPNVTFDTARSAFDPIKKVTNAPLSYLLNQQGHMKHVGSSQIRAVNYQFLPAGAMESDFILCVDPFIDILLYDLIINIRLLDGITPWPLPLTNNEFWRVEYIHWTPPGCLVHRECYTRRVTAGGQPT